MSQPYIVEPHVDEGYVLATLTSSWNAVEDTTPFGEEIIRVLDTADEPIWFIVDFSASTWSLDDAVFGANSATRTGVPFLRHPNMKMLVAAGATLLINSAIRGLNSPVFGKIPVHIVKTVDEAFAYIASP